MQKSSLALFVGYVLYGGLVRSRTFNRFITERPVKIQSSEAQNSEITYSGGTVFCNFKTRKSYKIRGSLQNMGSLIFICIVCSPYSEISEMEIRTK